MAGGWSFRKGDDLEAAARDALGCEVLGEPRTPVALEAGATFLIYFAQGAGLTFGAAFAVFVIVEALKAVLS
jgi:hypothetical protein